MPVIEQIPLRNRVRDRIAEQLWKGSYTFGDDLNEARLASELGVSRTPLREALVMLASEGLIVALPNRGFHVPTVDADAVGNLYDILATLEGMAVESLQGDLQKLADDLRGINQQLAEPGASQANRNKADARWHARLIANAPNPLLRDEIESLWARSRGIDGALLRGLADVDGSADDHENVAAAIAANDLNLAARLIREHWHNGIAVVSRWIAEQVREEAV